MNNRTFKLASTFSPLQIPNCSFWVESDCGLTVASRTVALKNAAVQDAGGGAVRIFADYVGIPAGVTCTIAGTVNYDGTYVSQAFAGNNDGQYVQILHPYVAETPPVTATVTINSAVSAWADQGPLGTHAVQADAARRPTLTTLLNGHPAVSFIYTGTQYMAASASAISNLPGFTYTTVAQFFHRSDNGASRLCYIPGLFRDSTKLKALCGGYNSCPAPTAVPHVISMVFDGTQPVYLNRLRIYIDNVPMTMTTEVNVTGTTYGAVTSLTLGALADGTYPCTAHMAYFSTHCRALSAEELGIMHRALGNKYGITVA